MKTVQITIVDNTTPKAPLFMQYDGQMQPQAAYISITPEDCDSAEIEVQAYYDGNISGVPSTVWHNRELRYTVPAEVSRDYLEDLADNAEFCELIRTIVAGHSVEWDNSNLVGRLTEAAQVAGDELEEMLQTADTISIWSAGDWLDSVNLSEFLEAGSSAKMADDLVGCVEDDQQIDGDLCEAIQAMVLEDCISYRSRNHVDGTEMHTDALEILKAEGVDGAEEELDEWLEEAEENAADE